MKKNLCITKYFTHTHTHGEQFIEMTNKLGRRILIVEKEN